MRILGLIAVVAATMVAVWLVGPKGVGMGILGLLMWSAEAAE